MSDKDRMAAHLEQKTGEDHTQHSWTATEGPAFQRHKNTLDDIVKNYE